jgi:chemotaxis response regulator CheB
VAAAVREHEPDVVLMDIRMPVMDGLAATRALTRRGTRSPQVIVLTTFDEHGLVLEAMRAGAAGFLVKHAVPEEIVEAVRRAARGEPALSPSAARALVEHAAAGPGDRAGTRPAADRVAHHTGARGGRGGCRRPVQHRNRHPPAPFPRHGQSPPLQRPGQMDRNNRVQLALLTHDARPRP